MECIDRVNACWFGNINSRTYKRRDRTLFCPYVIINLKNLEEIRDRYLRDSLPVRLGGISADLARIASFASLEDNWKVVQSLLEESEFFIEWTAPEASLEEKAFLVELQIQLAFWHRIWTEIYTNSNEREKLSQQASSWSKKVLEMSGLVK